jgi:hypothetical protein
MPLAVKAKSGAGSQLLQGNGASPEVFTKLAQLTQFKKSGEKQASEKTTNQDSSTDTHGRIYEELLGTIVTGGTIDCTVNYVPGDATHRSLLAAVDGAGHNFKICGPNDPLSSPLVPLFTIAFSGVLLDTPDLELAVDKAMSLTIKISVISAPVWTYSS